VSSSVERITVEAWLDDDQEELQRARRSDDPSWRRWADEYDRGQALVASIRVRASYARDGEPAGEVSCANRAIWLEKSAHPPTVEAQLQDVASKDAGRLSELLADEGVQVEPDELAAMAAHVELDPELRAELRAGSEQELPSPDGAGPDSAVGPLRH
jgi:hypothetical protein